MNHIVHIRADDNANTQDVPYTLCGLSGINRRVATESLVPCFIWTGGDRLCRKCLKACNPLIRLNQTSL